MDSKGNLVPPKHLDCRQRELYRQIDPKTPAELFQCQRQRHYHCPEKPTMRL